MSFFKNQSKLIKFSLVFFLIIGICSIIIIPVVTEAENSVSVPDADGKIGLDTAIYVLQLLTGLRNAQPSDEDIYKNEYLNAEFKRIDMDGTTFYIQTTEVIQLQWKTLTGENPSYFSNCGDNCPVENISWNDIQTVIEKLNIRNEGTYRLPSEKEWEYSAKAEGSSTFGKYLINDECKEATNLDEIGWYSKNTGSNSTKSCKTKLPNCWGLYDMHGNVKEWCQDYYGKEDTHNNYRVVKGGAFNDDESKCSSASIEGFEKDDKIMFIGFRLVVENPPVTPVVKPDSPVVTAEEGDGQIILSWEPVTNVEITGYRINDIGINTNVCENNLCSYKITGLQNDTTYTYKITAVSGDLESDPTEVSATPKESEPPKYTITATAGTNGTISPSGAVSVNEGESKTFNFIPNAGYEIADVKIDGVSVGIRVNYTFTNVTANHTLYVTFKVPDTTDKFVWVWTQDKSLKVEWNGGANSSYRVYWNTKGNVTASDNSQAITGTAFYHTGLANGTTYYYKVAAAGDSNISALPEIQATPKSGIENSFTNSLGMTFKLIPAGTFLMGSPSNELGRPTDADNEIQHQVTLTKPFYMQTTEVTQGQWKAITGNNPAWFRGDDNPVESVSWNIIQDFIYLINKRGEGTYRLPSEAEWEYSARAGSSKSFANGNITETGCGYDKYLTEIGWYCGDLADKIETREVAKRQENIWGLYDMHGNVWEWCQDVYTDYSNAPVTDPEGADSGSYKVIRGGGFYDTAADCRSAKRSKKSYSSSKYDRGFRMIVTLP